MARILVIDDDPDIQELVKAYLAEFEHEVISAADGFAAMDLLEKHRVDLALVDIEMPFSTGFEVVQKFRQGLRNKLLPVAFLTGRTAKRDIERAIALDAEGYIVKPIEKKAFCEKIEGILKNKPPLRSTALAIDPGSAESNGEINIKFTVKIAKISELGVVMECKAKLEENVIVELSALLFKNLNIEEIQFKLLNQKWEEKRKIWVANFMYYQVSAEKMGAIQAWLTTQTRITDLA